MQGSRAECALARSIRKLIVLYFYDFRRRIVDALNIVSLCTQKNRNDRDQIEHMLALILAIDV